MDISEVIAAIGGPNPQPAKPDGPSEITPLNSGGLDKTSAEAAPPNVTAAQGAGSGYLTPGAQGQAADGTVEPGNDDHYADQGGPALLSPSSGLSALTPDPSHGRPDGGADSQPAAPVGRPDHALGRDQSLGQGINPALKAALTPRQHGEGLFGKPSL